MDGPENLAPDSDRAGQSDDRNPLPPRLPATGGWAAIRLFLVVFIPLVLAVGLISYSAYRLESDSWREELEASERATLKLSRSMVFLDMANMVSDLMFWADQRDVVAFCQNQTNADRQGLVTDLINFALHKHLYDQIRYIDTDGQEKIRIDFIGSDAFAIAEDHLQSKADRYYFREAIRLKKGEVYVSPMDLNVERGRLELPYKPMVRLATALFDPRGQKRGILIFNVLGDRILSMLRQEHQFSPGQLMVLNRDGYWLVNTRNKNNEWGFMISDRRDKSMAKLQPDIWWRIKAGQSDQFWHGSRLYTFTTVDLSVSANRHRPAGAVAADQPGRIWKLVTVVPAGEVRTTLTGLRLRFGAIFGLLALLAAVGAVVVTRTRLAGKRARAELLQSNRDLNIWASKLAKRNREMNQLNQLVELLQACDTTQEIHGIASQFLPKLFPDSSGAIYITGPDGKLLIPATDWGDRRPTAADFYESACWALRKGRPHLAAAGEGPRCDHLTREPESASLCVPLIAHGAVIGLLTILLETPEVAVPGETNQEKRTELIQLAVNVADLVALSQANITLRETLCGQAIRDPLTGLYNRRYMEESLGRELRRAERSGEPVSLIMFDVDHFKNFNDTYGHEAGDLVLSELGGLVQEISRSEDVACRYGGEEFLLILPSAGLDIASQRAETIRRRVEDQLRLIWEGRRLPKVTISLGVASYPAHGRTADEVVSAADQALYRAKEGGRNRVETADE